MSRENRFFDTGIVVDLMVLDSDKILIYYRG